jgi:hypothetical protein
MERMDGIRRKILTAKTKTTEKGTQGQEGDRTGKL